MTEEEKINELAETLKQRGLAASMADAIDKAKSIICGIKTPIPKKEPESTPKVEIRESSTPEKEISRENTDPRINAIDNEISALEAKKDEAQEKLIKIEEDYDIMQDNRTLGEIMHEAEEETAEERGNEADKENDEASEELEPFKEGNEQTLQTNEDLGLLKSEELEPFKEGNETDKETDEISEELEPYSELPSIDDIEELDNNKETFEEGNMIKTIEEETDEGKPTLTQSLMEESDSSKEEENSSESEDVVIEEAEEKSDTHSSENEEAEKTSEPEEDKNSVPEKEPAGLSDEEKEQSDLTKIFNFGKR